MRVADLLRGEHLADVRAQAHRLDGRHRVVSRSIHVGSRSTWSASRKDAYKDATVTTAIGEEHVAQLDVLGIATPNFAVTGFPLGHQNLDGLVGMNFLRHFNFEIRPAEQLIQLELIAP